MRSSNQNQIGGQSQFRFLIEKCQVHKPHTPSFNFDFFDIFINYYIIMSTLATTLPSLFNTHPIQGGCILTAISTSFIVLFFAVFGNNFDQNSDGDFDSEDVISLFFDNDNDGNVTPVEWFGGGTLSVFGVLVFDVVLFQWMNTLTNLWIEASPERVKLRAQKKQRPPLSAPKICNDVATVCEKFKSVYVVLAVTLIIGFLLFFTQDDAGDVDGDGDVDLSDLLSAIDTDDDGTLEFDEAAGAIALAGGGSVGLLLMAEGILVGSMLWLAYFTVRLARAKDTKEMQTLQQEMQNEVRSAELEFERREITAIQLQQKRDAAAKRVLDRASAAATEGNLNLKDTDLELNMNKVGGGSFGAVFLGKFAKRPHGMYGHLRDKHQIAAKILIKQASVHSPEAYDKEQQKFLKERQILSTLQKHPNIVFLHGYVPSPQQNGTGILYNNVRQPGLVLEAIGEGDLEKAIHDPTWKQGSRLSGSDRFDVVQGLARGLKFLHQQVPAIIHKDLKPGNILVQVLANGKVVPKITDYGESTTTGDEKGGGTTQGYAPPEYWQDCGVGTPTTKFDVFSFGVIVNEIYSRTPPFYDLEGVNFLWNQSNNAMDASASTPLANQIQSLQKYLTEMRPTLANSCDWSTLVQQCWSQNLNDRPEMREVLSMLSSD